MISFPGSRNGLADVMFGLDPERLIFETVIYPGPGVDLSILNPPAKERKKGHYSKGYTFREVIWFIDTSRGGFGSRAAFSLGW